MNSLGLNIILRMGCLCAKERVTLNNKSYNVKERLGQGGFSVVDLVENTQTHEIFALKRIVCHSPEDQKVAMTEIEFHKVVQHPGVLEVVDYDLRKREDPLEEINSEVLILLPYYRRGTLAQELARREATKSYLSEQEVLRTFRLICDAVKAFHEVKPNPLAHRDLKTANILIDDQFNPIIMDLGSTAKARAEITETMEARQLEELAAERCSMPYRAPELFNIPSRIDIDERTDIWSLGCILFALCFFKSPFDIVFERHDSVPLAIVSGRIEIPNDSPYSESIHELIRFMLVVDPKQRPFIYDVIKKVETLEAQLEGCV